MIAKILSTAYKYGYSMVKYIVESFGQEKLYELLKSYGNIKTCSELSENEFINNWIEFLKNEIK